MLELTDKPSCSVSSSSSSSKQQQVVSRSEEAGVLKRLQARRSSQDLSVVGSDATRRHHFTV